MPTLRDIIWLAGLYEGEGSFSYQHTPIMRIGMCDLDIIERVRNLIGGRIESKILAKENIKPQYVVRISGKHAAAWMMTIYTMMGIRRKLRIKEILIKWKNAPGSGKWKTIDKTAKLIQVSRKVSYEEAKELAEMLLRS